MSTTALQKTFRPTCPSSFYTSAVGLHTVSGTDGMRVPCWAWTQIFHVKSVGIFLATSPQQLMRFADASSPWPMHQKHHLRVAISRAAWPYARALATNLSAWARKSK